MTKRIQRQRPDPTPAPLPPSPGARDAERWFEQVPTNPAAQLNGPGDTTGSHRKSGKFERGSGLHPGDLQPRVERQWLVMFLIAAIALTIGMILGALVFSSSKAKKCEPCADALPSQPKQ